MKKKPRAGKQRKLSRAVRRQHEKLGEQRERLFLLEPGGSAARPLEVASPSVVETQAVSVPCPRCAGPHELVEHAAVTVAGVRLREARLRCRSCGARRSLFFRLSGANVN
jgi:transposase-like protein